MDLPNKRPDDMARITTPELAQAFIEEQVAAVRAQVGDKKVLLALSGGVDSSVAAALIYVFQFLFNFIVPSGSGKAAITMPLIVPMADMAGITRQTAVLAFQLGDGPTNLFWPTAAMSYLAMGNVPYSKWAKWYFPLVVILFVVSIITVLICTQMGYGPF